MATITLPSTPKPRGTEWRLEMPAQVNVSQWTGARQALSSGRGWWECTFSLPTIGGAANASPWRSFMAQMRGGANDCQVPVDGVSQRPFPSSGTATLWLDFAETDYYSDGGTDYQPLVNGASQTGRTLITDGWNENATTLVEGQFITINNQLLILTADVTADNTGAATISFEPPLRASPADNAAIEFREPYALMYLTEPKQGYNYDTGVFYSFSFEFREAF